MEITLTDSDDNSLYADITELVGERRLIIECADGDNASVSLSVEQALGLAEFINKWFKPDEVKE